MVGVDVTLRERARGDDRQESLAMMRKPGTGLNLEVADAKRIRTEVLSPSRMVGQGKKSG